MLGVGAPHADRADVCSSLAREDRLERCHLLEDEGKRVAELDSRGRVVDIV